MVPVFGATGIILTNRGTEDRTIEKIVLRGSKITTKAVVKPAANQFSTDAFAQNLKDKKQDNINSALADIIEYYKPQLSADGDHKAEGQDFIEVYIKSGNTISHGESMNLIVMTGAAEVAEENDVVMDVYSTRGVIRDIKLTTKYTAKDEDDIVTDKALTAIGTGQKIEVEFSHSTFEVENSLPVYSEDDLAQLIKWNAEAKTEREISATLKNNVVLTNVRKAR